MKIFFTFISLALLSSTLMANVTVTIDYADKKPTKKIEVHFKEGMTALALLQSVSDVSTKNVGKYTFITSIDGVKSKPRKMGWFYQIDGKDADKVASANVLGPIETMKWEYRADNCLSRLK